MILKITLSPQDLKRLMQASEQAIESIKQLLEASVAKIDRTAKLLIDRGPKSGKQYGRHQASAPGEAPATNTGRLIQSIAWQVLNQGFTVEIGSPLDYASYLENGTRNMDPRPWLKPAYDQHVDTIVSDITSTLKKYL